MWRKITLYNFLLEIITFFQKNIDVWKIYDIIFISAKKYPNS